MDLNRHERADAIARIQGYFLEERDEEIGELAAGTVLDFIVEEFAPTFYNRGIRDATAITGRQFQSLEEELQLLESHAKALRRE